jgi:16S rRNA processing protein RimM
MSEDASGRQMPVGRIVGAFGLRGEAKVRGADPAAMRAGLRASARLPNGSRRELIVASVRPHQDRLLVRFEGISGPEGIDALRGAELFAEEADLPPLPAGIYHDRELVGMTVIDERLGALGEVREVRHYPQADMLVVGDRELLVPMLRAYGVRVDRDARKIATALPEGFEEIL